MIRRQTRAFRPTLDSLDARVLLSALGPAQIRQAYSENINFNVGGRSYAGDGSGQTIAIVIGGLDNFIYNDLQKFDQQFGLPDPNFKSVYFQGAQNTLTVDGSTETAMDVEWAHAVAPRANLLLVQAASMQTPDLINAVNWARQQSGVSVVSMSWGAAEYSGDHAYDSVFTTPAGHAGVTFVASSGDSGAWTNAQKTQVGVSWPACVPTVLSVGGTTLSTTSNGGYLGESAWSNGGGGYSRYYAEPSYQRGVQNTGVRTVPDVSYDADPNSGVWVYNTYAGGWLVEGGTSAGAPQWAGLIALADQGRSLIGQGPLDGASQTLPALYGHSSDFRDIVGGSNGFPATRGYDLATGLGTPYAVSLIGDLSFHAPGNFSPNSMARSNAVTPADADSGQSRVAASPLHVGLADSTPAVPPGLRTAKVAVAATTGVAHPSAARAAILQIAPRRFDLHDDALSSLFDEAETA